MTKIPEGYRSSLSLYDTQKAIEQVKNVFLTKLCAALKLSRVTAPLIVDPLTGMNDNLNGVEHPVAFDLPNVGKNAEVVQSLAKWKRYALWRYNFAVGRGLVCDMNAIRRDEQPDNLHSIYVDQWDWERIITQDERNTDTLEDAVCRIVEAICGTLDELKWHYPQLNTQLSRDVAFVTSQELEDLYPTQTPKQREDLFHKMLVDGELPFTIGGGIGQSRLCMLLLEKAHVGEVQASIWDKQTEECCTEAGVSLL